MTGKGKFSGFAWHTEYHTVDPKKEKAADCTFLDQERICNCKDSPTYLGNCFVASTCKYRVKSKQGNLMSKGNINQSKKVVAEKYQGIKCSLPIGTKVWNKKNAIGKVTGYKMDQRILYVSYPDKDTDAKYQYPEAFLNGFLKLDDKYKALIEKDLKHVKE